MAVSIEHVVFDIGKVLVHWDPEIPYRRLIPDAGQRRWFLENVCTPAWNMEQDRGRPWPEAEALLIDQWPEHAEMVRAYRKHWHEMVPHSLDGSVAILEEVIASGMDVTMLTNFASDTFREAQERFVFLKKPRGVTVSGDVRLIKPDVAIYEHHNESQGLKREATLFIDDSAANIEAARKFGWQAIHFTDAQALRNALNGYGITT